MCVALVPYMHITRSLHSAKINTVWNICTKWLTGGTGGIEKTSNTGLSDIKTEVTTKIIAVSKLNEMESTREEPKEYCWHDK